MITLSKSEVDDLKEFCLMETGDCQKYLIRFLENKLNIKMKYPNLYSDDECEWESESEA